MRCACLAAVLLAGCSLYGGGDDVPDGPPRWPGEGLPSCATTRTSYVVDAVTVPSNADLVDETGRDLDDDGTIDNQLGNAISALIQYLRFDIQGRTDEALAADALLIGMTVERCNDDYLLIELHRGTEIDRSVDPPVLRIDDTSDLAAVDRVRDEQWVAVHGQGRLPPTALFDATETEWVPSVGIEIELATVDEVELEGVVAAGLDQVAFHDAVVPVIHRYVSSQIEGQPGCPAACEDPDLADIVDIFDQNGDSVITEAEVADNSLVQVLDRPDLDLITLVDGEPTYWPGQDDEPESLSFGIGFHATVVELAD